MIQQMVAEYMSPLGFRLILAKKEGGCLERVDNSVDVIVIDTHLPAAGVAQMLEKMRKRGVTVPVLLLGGNYGVSSYEEAIELGANGFIEKPFRLKEFLEHVLRVLPN